MTRVVRGATVAVVVTLALWCATSAGVALTSIARAEYALAADEARTLARALESGAGVRPSPRRRVVADGSLVRARIEMRRAFGPAATRALAVDRAAVHRRWARRAVSQPVKDADQWDVVGAIALEAEPWRHAPPILAVLVLALLVSAATAVRGIRTLAADRSASVYSVMIIPVAALATATAIVTVLVRLRLDAAIRALPPHGPLTRFDTLALPVPGGPITSLALLLLLVGAAVALFAAGWSASVRRHAAERRETLTAWSFLAPSALHLVVFTAGPLVFTLFVSLHDWDLLQRDRPFVAFANYAELAGDPLFWNALRNTALYSLYVPVSMAIALGAALVLDQPLRGVRLLRALVFLPTIVSYVAIAIVWQWMFNTEYGLLNYLLRLVQLPGVDWLSDPRTALLAVMIVSAWVQVGYQMVIYLAGLQGIPAWLHEAARLDGAGTWQRFRFITVPMLRPVTIYLFVTGIIWSFQVFTLVYVMTEGGPVHSTDVLVYQIYQNAWEFRRMGYASALSWVLFALLLVLTIVQWRVVNRRIDHVA